MSITRLYKVIVMMSSLTLLSSSSFFLSNYLTDKVLTGRFNENQFNYAVKMDNVEALKVAVNEQGITESRWLTLSRKLAKYDGVAAISLGKYYFKLAGREKGGLYTGKAKMWFYQAIRLNTKAGFIGLAKLNFKQGNIIQAKENLQRLALLNAGNSNNTPTEDEVILSLKIAIYQGEVNEVKSLYSRLVQRNYLKTNSLNSDEHEQLLADVLRFQVLPQNPKLDVVFPLAEDLSSCLSNLQLFATNLAHLEHLEKLISQFKSQQTLGRFICLPTPRYISKKQLQCINESDKAISCEESRWQKVASSVNTQYIGLMLENGGANVHLGMLYFDVKDDVNVFSHEVSHLLGFVDEYPLVTGHEACQKPQQKPFSHNIVTLKSFHKGDRDAIRKSLLSAIPWSHLINKETPILTRVKPDQANAQYWQLGTPSSHADKVGLFTSETCSNARDSKGKSSEQLIERFEAYKPVMRATQLRYYSHEFPEEYMTLITAAPFDFLMPSFHYNIALALYQQGKVVQAKRWLQQSLKFEESRKSKERFMKRFD